MLLNRSLRNLFVIFAISAAAVAGATDDYAHERHELMGDVRDATKPVGDMLKGKSDFDAATLQASLAMFAEAAEKLGGLVPEGSEGGEAAPAIWEDPEGFAAAIEEWRAATAAAIEANPQSLSAAKPIVGPVLGSCKNCHDGYRIEKD